MKVFCWIRYSYPVELANVMIGVNQLTKLVLMYEDYIVRLGEVVIISIIPNDIDFLSSKEWDVSIIISIELPNSSFLHNALCTVMIVIH